MAACVRAAWLELGSNILQLEDSSKGYFCESLDLGYPAVRDVTSNRPDQMGIDDRTSLFGARVITADIKALAGAGAQIDDVASDFGPFMNPASRPILHYVLDRPGYPERTVVVRASGYQWEVAGPSVREIHLSWVAADPIMRDATIKTATAWAGSGSVGGRLYNLTFNRGYAAGGSSPTLAPISPAGDVGVRPLFRIYGPATTPQIIWYLYNPFGQNGSIRMVAGYQVFANHYLEIDSATKTAYVDGDVNQPAMASIDWQNTAWPLIGPAPGYATMQLAATSTSAITQVQAIWRDGYLT
jgi:hypothetical protein